MKKIISVVLVAILLLQTIGFATNTNTAVAAERKSRIPTTGGTVIDPSKRLPEGDITLPSTTTGEDPTHGDLSGTNEDPTHGDSSVGKSDTGNSEPNDSSALSADKSADTTSTMNKVEASTFLPELTASEYTSKPKNPEEGYTEKNKVFIDWNTKTSTWWFKCNYVSSMPDNVVYQVSMVPFAGTDKDPYNVPGLLLQQTMTLNEQHELCVNLSDVLPRKEMLVKNYTSPALISAMANGIDSQDTNRSSRSFEASFRKNALALAPKIGNNNARRFQSAFEKNLSTIKSSSLNLNRNVLKDSVKNKATFTPTSDKLLLAQRDLMEANFLPSTMQKFYVRYFVVDSKYNPVGEPSNQITIFYGEPSWEGYPEILPEHVSGDNATSEYSEANNTMYVKWSATPRPTCRVRFYSQDIPRDQVPYQYYQYTYYQIIKGTQEPVIDSDNLRNPSGLVATYRSYQPWMDIDVQEFVSKMNVKEHWTENYFVRAIHIYADYDNPGCSRVAVSPAVQLIYGDKPSTKVKDTKPPVQNAVVDIGTPYIRFVQYSAPYLGDNPSDHIVVVKKPGGVFNWLKVGDKKRVRDLKSWLENEKSKEPWYTQMAEAFGSLFSMLTDLVNSISSTWAKIQSLAVSCMSVVGIPPQLGGFLLNAALVAAGIPPSLPNFDELSNMGVAYLAETIVQQSGGYIPPDMAKDVANELAKQTKSAANTMLSDLPDGLDDLEGYIQQDSDYVWKPATITIELYNTYENEIPSGEFNLKTGIYNTERITYPALKSGQKLKMTVTLDESIRHSIIDGEKKFYDGSPYSSVHTQWDELTNYGKNGFNAEITDLMPHMPENIQAWIDEIGLRTQSNQAVTVNMINNGLHISSNLVVGKDWKASNDNFASIIYVSNYGKDSAAGTERKPIRTIAKAVSMAGDQGIIYLNPGVYSANEIKANGITIVGLGKVIINADAKSEYALCNANIKNLIINGGVKDGTRIENSIVKNSWGIGIDGTMYVYNCEVSNTGKGGEGLNCGIYNPVEAVNCTVHNIVGEGIVEAKSKADISKMADTGLPVKLQGCEVYQCTTGIYFNTINSTVDNCNIHNCTKGIMVTGNHNHISNCYIHDMDQFGVGYLESLNCGISNCTLKDTSLPIIFLSSVLHKNNITVDSDDHGNPVYANWFAKNCIMVETQGGKNNGLMVMVENNENGCGLNDDAIPYMLDNIYYWEYGPVCFQDRRKGSDKGNMKYNDVLSVQKDGYTINKWEDYASDGLGSDSKELDPKLDSRGHSSLPECKGMGVQ